jgi:RsiW-degrading membrane proteinase PrsW (M82 family)
MTATAVVRTARISAAVICAAGLAILAWVFAGLIREFSDAAVLAVGLELPVVVTGYWLARLLRPVRPPSRLWSAAAVLWGATAATGCAIFANQGLTTIWAKGAGITFASNWGAALTAPLNEELLKVSGVAMIVLAVPGMIRGPLDGMVFGALAGLGFQVMENVTYGLNAIAQFGATNPPQAVAISAFVRVVITGLGSHWTMTAVSGAGIGFLVSRGARRGWLPAAGCLATAMGMHLFFDAPGPATAVKVFVNFAIAGGLYVWLRLRYRTRARSALAARIAAGGLSGSEAADLLSRRGRRLAYYRAARDERPALAERQRQLVAEIDQTASAS